MWNYLFYIYNIMRDKDQTQFNGVEAYIHSKLTGDDQSAWFPIGMALCMQQDEESEVNEKTVEFADVLDSNLGKW